MKILQLKFKNINSLAGEWQIDFTQPRFTGNGIFAITGKTGAGKTSILDAISLALFGKTPRVEITGLSNDVMTRGESDCYSEIVFEVNGKKWKASWKQERTRTGNLKPVSRRIADGADKIVADQVRLCDGKIVEILGLTFEQFTKVVMLAQGSFAAFLQADKNDKGELLEQITGTEIYGEISKKIYERNKTEKEKLDKILVELGAIKMLPQEEIAARQNEIAMLERQKTVIDSELQEIETAKKWFSDWDILQKQLAEAKSKSPALQQQTEQAQAALKLSEDALKKVNGEKTETEKILLKVRELDTRIAEKDRLLNPILQSIEELASKNTELSQMFEKQTAHLEELQKELADRKKWVLENQKYEALARQYTAIENQNSQVLASQNDLNSKQEEFESAKKELSGKTAALREAQSGFIEKDTALNRKILELETKKAELSEILSGKEFGMCHQGKDLNDYRQEKENITNFGIQIKDLIEVETEIFKNRQEIARFTETIAACEQAEKQLSKRIADNKTAAANLENQINLLDENIKLAKTIQSLAEHRKALEDGTPCPLCGALEHPYAIGNMPQPDGKETDLQDLKQQFQTVSTAVRQDETTLAKGISDRDNALKNKEKEEQLLLANKEKRMAVLNTIATLQSDFSIPENQNQIVFLKEIHTQKLQEYKQVSALIAKATDCENAVGKIQNEELPTLQKAKEGAEKAKNDAETTQKLAEQQAQTKQTLLEETEKIYKEKNAELLKTLNEYDVKNINNLKNCFDNWSTNQRAANELTEQIRLLETELALITSNIDNNKNQLESKTAEKHGIETDRWKLSAQRCALFGDKQVAYEENRLKILLENAAAAKTAAETTNTFTAMELAKNLAVIAEKEKEAAEKRERKITGKPLEELLAEYDDKKPQSDRISQQIGAIRQMLTANSEKLKTSGKKLKDKEFQQQICHRWGGLNELIGSADGKKYRNFAQALTFEHLIGLANRQLQKMSDRYLLKRVGDAANPFELSVIDKYQNCEERTAQNLSGGEKFIASLSLALGLAGMASRNMQIDTMFIDEGFGTLDSDYLDTALSALSNLQNEGKLTGVISHLTELKERIATHIEVVPDGSGHSRIEII